MVKKLILGLLGLILSANVQAAFHCQVEVVRVLVYKSGTVNILHSGRNDYTNICNLKGNWNNVDSVTCAMWTSLLQNVQSNGQKAVFYYSGEGSCETLPTYGAAPVPVYIGSMKR